MIKYIFLVVIFTFGMLAFSLDDGCMECYETGVVDCALCFGTGDKISKCTHCKGTGLCKACKGGGGVKCVRCDGSGFRKCRTCRGKGVIRKESFSVGKGVRPGVQSKNVDCPNCSRGLVACTKCERTGQEKCRSCGRTGICRQCLGSGIVREKSKCRGCKGSLIIKCRNCASGGKVKNAKLLTIRRIIPELDRVSDVLENGTGLQEKKALRDFVLRWNDCFSGKIVLVEANVNGISEVVDGHIDLLLQSSRLTIALRVLSHWEDSLMDVSAEDTLSFLTVLRKVKLTDDRRCVFGDIGYGIGFDSEKPTFDMIVDERPVPVLLLGYTKRLERGFIKFDPVGVKQKQ